MPNTNRVSEQVERNNARLDQHYSGATEHSRRALQLREAYLRTLAVKRLREG